MTGDARVRKDGLKAQAHVADQGLTSDAGAKPAQKDFGSSWCYYSKNCFQQRAQFPRPMVMEWQVEQASEQHA